MSFDIATSRRREGRTTHPISRGAQCVGHGRLALPPLRRTALSTSAADRNRRRSHPRLRGATGRFSGFCTTAWGRFRQFALRPSSRPTTWAGGLPSSSRFRRYCGRSLSQVSKGRW